MANERNKILPYALSAIEGVNIQSQEDYAASMETTNGVSTGLANGNNFNRLAKQVSIMSSSLAEFIVDTLAEQTISDTNSVEEISSALNNAVLKLIKDNEPVISDQSGIKVIDENNTDITSFNQITEDGIYYIYKNLTDAPLQYTQASVFSINLIVLNVSIKSGEDIISTRLQLISTNIDGYTAIISNIGLLPMVRTYDKDTQQWSEWLSRYGIIFNRNNIAIETFRTTNKSQIRFPIIAKDTTFDSVYDEFMYSATKEQMREQLGIADQPDLTDYFNKKTDKLDLATQVTGQLKNANIADNAITTSKIASLAITADKLASNSVTNAKISDGAVTNAKFSGQLSVAKGGTGASTIEAAQTNLRINDFKRYNYERLDLNKAKNGVVVCRKDYLTNAPSSDLSSSGEILIETILGQSSTTFSDNDAYTYNLQIYKERNSHLVLERICKPNGVVGEWKKLRNADGSIPENLIPVKAPKHYTTSAGHWIETTLSDGTVMLQGAGTFSNILNIELPKRCSIGAFDVIGSSIGYIWPVTKVFTGTRISAIGYAYTTHSTVSVMEDFRDLNYKNWNFMGILE